LYAVFTHFASFCGHHSFAHLEEDAGIGDMVYNKPRQDYFSFQLRDEAMARSKAVWQSLSLMVIIRNHTGHSVCLFFYFRGEFVTFDSSWSHHWRIDMAQ